MAEEAKPRHVRHRVNAGQSRELRPGAIEAGGGSYHRPIVRCFELTLLQCGRQNAHAKRLAEHERISRSRLRVAFQMLWMHDTECHQPINDFYRIDAVPAGNWDAGCGADRLAPAQDLANDLGWQHFD